MNHHCWQPCREWKMCHPPSFAGWQLLFWSNLNIYIRALVPFHKPTHAAWQRASTAVATCSHSCFRVLLTQLTGWCSEKAGSTTRAALQHVAIIRSDQTVWLTTFTAAEKPTLLSISGILTHWTFCKGFLTLFTHPHADGKPGDVINLFHKPFLKQHSCKQTTRNKNKQLHIVCLLISALKRVQITSFQIILVSWDLGLLWMSCDFDEIELNSNSNSKKLSKLTFCYIGRELNTLQIDETLSYIYINLCQCVTRVWNVFFLVIILISWRPESDISRWQMSVVNL